MKIAALSDTHGYHRSVDIPSNTDLILFAGDITNQGEEDILRDFNSWVGELRVPFICVAGNHDLSLEGNNGWAKQVLFNTIYLEHEYIEFKGLKIFGSPYCPKLPPWAFTLDLDQAEHKWSQLPEDLDILMVHGPAYKIRDTCLNGYEAGCKVLRKNISRAAPKISLVGHIHEAFGGPTRWSNTKFYNVSICDWPSNQPTNPVTIIEI
jgi:Icc-related predicted phosphoesterase